MKPNISNSYTRNSYLLTVTWDQPSVTVTHGTVVHWQSHETEHEQQLHTEQLFIDNHMGPNICHSYTRNSFLLTITWDQTSVKLHTEQLFIDSHMVPTICKSYTGNSCLLTITWDRKWATVTHGAVIYCTWDRPPETVTHRTVIYWRSYGTEHLPQLHTKQLFIDNHMGPNISKATHGTVIHWQSHGTEHL
jgi:hypothetical protein